MAARFLNLFILFMMGINGALYLAWYLSSPHPDRIGYWVMIYFIVFPVLGCTGLLALVQHTKLLKWIGGILLLYVGGLTVLSFAILPLLDRFVSLLPWLPQGSVEAFHVISFVIALITLLVLMFRR